MCHKVWINMSMIKLDMSLFHTTDLIVLGVMVVSTLIGLVRGFTREILGALGWLSATLLTFWTRSFFKIPLHHWIGNPLASDVITIVAIFVISLFVFLSITRAASYRVKASVLGGLDRSLGVIFGLLRGGIICIVLFVMLSLYVKPHKRPPDVTESQAFPYLLKGTALLAAVLPPGTIPAIFYHPHPHSVDHKDERISLLDNPSAQELMRTLAQPRAGSAQRSEKEGGYNDENRRHMDRLFKNYGDQR